MDGIFHVYSIYNTILCKHALGMLIRRCVAQRLINVCTVCLCHINRLLGFFVLKQEGPRVMNRSPELFVCFNVMVCSARYNIFYKFIFYN